jgi:hypothetical protein
MTKEELPEEAKVLDYLQNKVAGYVQAVPLTIPLGNGVVTLWLNEEGKLQEGLELNKHATALWESCYGETDLLMGNVVVTSENDEGEVTGLDEGQMNHLIRYLSVMV